MLIKVTKDGPYIILGNIPLEGAEIVPDAENFLLAWKETGKIPTKENYSLCRCGKTKNPPFCDGSHTSAGFDGRVTSNNKPFDIKANEYSGAALTLLDAEEFCARAHFCTRASGTWDLVELSHDEDNKNMAIREVADCPSGRLVLINKKTGREIEPPFEPSITLIEDTLTGTSGPLWVKGKIPIESSDGKIYELRNRVTLCRCGSSRNKPFCDGKHIDANFKAANK